jgi:hypothetical protein
MIVRKALVALVSAGMVFGSTSVAAAPAMDNARVASPVSESEGVGGWHWILALIILAGIIGVIAADSEPLPTSP